MTDSSEEAGFLKPDDPSILAEVLRPASPETLEEARNGCSCQQGKSAATEEQPAPAGMTRWRKKPVEVSMIRWDGSDEARRLIIERGGSMPLPGGIRASVLETSATGTGLRIWVDKSQAPMWLDLGDWAILEPDGVGVYPCTAEQQAAAYEPASSPPGQVTVSREDLKVLMDATRADRRRVVAEAWTRIREATGKL